LKGSSATFDSKKHHEHYFMSSHLRILRPNTVTKQEQVRRRASVLASRIADKTVFANVPSSPNVLADLGVLSNDFCYPVAGAMAFLILIQRHGKHSC
jgi:hypothetical protein